MASRIQGITVEIGGDTTKLSKALESVNKSIKGTQSGLKDALKALGDEPAVWDEEDLVAFAAGSTKLKIEADASADNVFGVIKRDPVKVGFGDGQYTYYIVDVIA